MFRFSLSTAAAIIAAVMLSACSANSAASSAAQEAADQIPVAMMFPFATGDYTSTKPSNELIDFDQNAPIHILARTLIAKGYATKAYRYNELQSYAVLVETAKAKAAGWSCNNDAEHASTECQVPIGKMQIGKAEIRETNGAKIVAFVCTAVANELGANLHGAFDASAQVNWGDHIEDGPLELGKSFTCNWPVGADDRIERGNEATE